MHGNFFCFAGQGANNNHPDTTLAEIHDLLHIAQTRLEQRIR
jgi:hypothetical protein